MRVRLTEVRPHRNGMVVHLEIAFRQGWWLKKVYVPWAWVATDDIADKIMEERDRQHRSLQDPGRPWLPLETWE